MKHLFRLLVAAFLPFTLKAAPVDLSGEWRFALDPQDAASTVTPDQWRFPDRIRLPGMVTAQGFGELPSIKTEWTGEGWRYPEMFREWQADGNFKFPFFLQPPRHYVGPAWFQRDVEIPAAWKDSRVLLHLERVHWQSRVWLDGKPVGDGDSLGAAHEFDLGPLKPGRHVLTLRLDNRLDPVNVGPLSHSVTDHTQGNWNGIVGKMELRSMSVSRIQDLQVYPKADGSLKVVVSGTLVENGRVSAQVRQIGADESPVVLETKAVTRNPDGRFQVQLVGKTDKAPRLWNEFDPTLYELTAELLTTQGKRFEKKSVRFGFREVGTKDGRITINGRKSLLRGTLECGIFPLTGHPPTDVDSWKRIIRICKAHGLNHIRFHSWCPPEAAFIAADELGFYYQVEVSSWANQGAEIGSGRPLDAWIEKETARMLAVYGNHPSFLLMAYGNEPAGPNHAKWLQEWVARRKAEDPRRLYTTGAGWTIMPGSDFHSSPDPRIQAWGGGLKSVINGEAPRTDFDWSGFVKKHSDAPVISHEIGQWCVYPNFREIGKYTGFFKARNFEIFQETARRNGLLEQADDFLM
ncbi:MAG: sugar-binding domain-containing protein, partial [Luteolibacter sp.]